MRKIIDYLVVIGLAFALETFMWKSNIIPLLGYFGSVSMYVLFFLTVFHIGKLRGNIDES